ncbi:MAG TPA: hypothetical protein VNE39_19690 [Planctomycetota bacterium]|nr:hypothetical protein [Planctomycetota bacterium]
MRRCVLAVWCFLLLGVAADADVLKMRTGEELRGTVQLVTFLVKDMQSIYPREEIVSVQVAKEGDDTLEARSEGKQAGKLVSVMFDAPGGLRAVSGDKIAAITIDNATTLDTLKAQEKDEADTKEEQKSELSDEQKQALTANRELYKAYREAAEGVKDDGYESVKTKYMDKVRGVVNDIQRLEKSITNKIRRREQASSRTYTSSSGSNTHREMSERERLERNDNLAQDQREYERAKAAASKLKSTIRADERKVKEKNEQRVSRLETAYVGNRAKLFEGKSLTEDEMAARYDAAIRLPGEKAPKMPKAPNPDKAR